jgi:hypothetical protein
MGTAQITGAPRDDCPPAQSMPDGCSLQPFAAIKESENVQVVSNGWFQVLPLESP